LFFERAGRGSRGFPFSVVFLTWWQWAPSILLDEDPHRIASGWEVGLRERAIAVEGKRVEASIM
jgi:hypothetical protein